MEVKIFKRVPQDKEAILPLNVSADRVEIPLVAPDQFQYTILLIDAEDSFDVVVQEPDNTREIIWSLVKDDTTTSDEEEDDDLVS